MNIILLEKIRNLGNMGDQVTVKNGYARNFLIPFQKAVRATKDNLARFESRRAELEAKAKNQFEAAEQRATELQKVELIIVARASEEGKLFGSIGPREIVEAFKAKGVDVHRGEIDMPQGVIRQIGEYEIVVQVHTDLPVSLKMIVNAEVEEA